MYSHPQQYGAVYSAGTETQTIPVQETSETITINNLLQQRQSIILRLRNPDFKLPKKDSNSVIGWMKKLKKMTDDLNLLELLVKDDPDMLQNNIKKLDKMFDGMSESLNQQRANAKEEMQKMTPEQQDQFLQFMMHFGKFFKELFDMLREFTNSVAAFIKQGGKLDTDLLNDIFKDIVTHIKELFG